MLDDEDGGDDIGSNIILFPVARGVSTAKHVPTKETRAIAFRAAGYGFTEKQVSKLLGVSIRTLKKYYATELSTAVEILNFNVLQNMYNIATSPTHRGATAMSIFWSKTRMGFREVTRHEHTGEGGGAITHDVRSVDTIDVRSLTPEDREALKQTMLEALARRALPPPDGGDYEDAEFEDSDDDED